MKEAEIAEMKAKMEEMAHEFGDMLKVLPFSISCYLRRAQVWRIDSRTLYSVCYHGPIGNARQNEGKD
jgi:hypothetical protein